MSCKGAFGVYDVLPLADRVLQSLFEDTLRFLHSCGSIGRCRELASYLGPAMLAHLYMGLSELVMRGSEEKKNGKWPDPPKNPPCHLKGEVAEASLKAKE